MLKIVYTVNEDQLEKEKEWLKNQKVYPSFRDNWTLSPTGNLVKRVDIGAIVDESAALAIKLHRELKVCTPYKK